MLVDSDSVNYNLHGLNKRFGLKFYVGSQVQQKSTQRRLKNALAVKHCEYSNKDDDDSLNTLNDKKVFFSLFLLDESDVLYYEDLPDQLVIKKNLSLEQEVIKEKANKTDLKCFCLFFMQLQETLVGWGCKIHQLHLWWWGSTPGALGNLKYSLHCYYSQVHSNSDW